MDADLLGKALGAIASYAAARDVPAARVVFCDAAAVRRGIPAGRRRSPAGSGSADAAARCCSRASTCWRRADDFPPDGPILVITDGDCDVLRVRREHAYLIPEGARCRSPEGAGVPGDVIVTVPVNGPSIARGQGHAVVHAHHGAQREAGRTPEHGVR